MIRGRGRRRQQILNFGHHLRGGQRAVTHGGKQLFRFGKVEFFRRFLQLELPDSQPLELEPVAAGPAVRPAQDLHPVAGLQRMVQRHDATVDLGAPAAMAHLGVDGGRRNRAVSRLRQIDHLAARGEQVDPVLQRSVEKLGEQRARRIFLAAIPEAGASRRSCSSKSAPACRPPCSASGRRRRTRRSSCISSVRICTSTRPSGPITAVCSER
jgi:hypothetical protein